jgi:hypothetical protein
MRINLCRLMTLETFKTSLSQDRSPPPGLSPALKGLWWDGRDDWDSAHEAVQSAAAAEASWVHAYLHRKQGDLGNAAYWYRQAGRPMPSTSLPEEWEQIARELLAS